MHPLAAWVHRRESLADHERAEAMLVDGAVSGQITKI
jgi:hypothetical protein